MLRASFAEHLGKISAADADRRETEERRTIDRRMHLLRGGAVRVDETPAERAMRRSGMSGCSMLRRGLLPEPTFGSWCAMAWRAVRGTLDVPRRCGPWPPVEHTAAMAPLVRAMNAGREKCAEEDQG
jgi:hypothetical protein